MSRRAFLVARYVLATIVIAALGRIVSASYRTTLLDFEPWPASEQLLHPEQTGIAGIQSVDFLTGAGIRIAGWYVPSRNRAAVIVTHGSNADRSSMLPEIRNLAAEGFGVLAFDWPGDGQ